MYESNKDKLFKYNQNFLVESSKLFHNTSKRIFNLFQRSFVGSTTDVEVQRQNSNITGNQEALTPGKSTPTKDSKINSIAQNTEMTELSLNCHPKFKRFLSETSFRKYSHCNIILTVNEHKAQSNSRNSSQLFYDKFWPRRNSSV